MATKQTKKETIPAAPVNNGVPAFTVRADDPHAIKLMLALRDAGAPVERELREFELYLEKQR